MVYLLRITLSNAIATQAEWDVEGDTKECGGNNRHVRSLWEQGRVKEALNLLSGSRVNAHTYEYLIQSCVNSKALAEGTHIHLNMLQNGFKPNAYLETKLVIMYVKGGNLVAARQVFDKMPKRNLVAWTSLIAGYAQFGQDQEALNVFSEMQRAGMEPNEYTLSSVLKACAGIEALQQGEQLHARTIKADLESDVVLGNALIDMYAKCGRMEDACQVFGKMSRRDVVSFTGMIAGYAKHGSIANAREVFDRISQRDVFSWTAMISGYAKCGSIKEARQMFDKMPQRNVVSWNAMIAAYAQLGHGKDALILFNQMHQSNVRPNSSTFSSILGVFANMGALD